MKNSRRILITPNVSINVIISGNPVRRSRSLHRKWQTSDQRSTNWQASNPSAPSSRKWQPTNHGAANLSRNFLKFSSYYAEEKHRYHLPVIGEISNPVMITFSFAFSFTFKFTFTFPSKQIPGEVVQHRKPFSTVITASSVFLVASGHQLSSEDLLEEGGEEKMMPSETMQQKQQQHQQQQQQQQQQPITQVRTTSGAQVTGTAIPAGAIVLAQSGGQVSLLCIFKLVLM